MLSLFTGHTRKYIAHFGHINEKILELKIRVHLFNPTWTLRQHKLHGIPNRRTHGRSWALMGAHTRIPSTLHNGHQVHADVSWSILRC